MKDQARILKYKGKELATMSDIREALSALILDVKSGDITPKEARPIEKEINEKLKIIAQGLKIAKLARRLKTLDENGEKK